MNLATKIGTFEATFRSAPKNHETLEEGLRLLVELEKTEHEHKKRMVLLVASWTLEAATLSGNYQTADQLICKYEDHITKESHGGHPPLAFYRHFLLEGDGIPADERPYVETFRTLHYAKFQVAMHLPTPDSQSNIVDAGAWHLFLTAAVERGALPDYPDYPLNSATVKTTHIHYRTLVLEREDLASYQRLINVAGSLLRTFGMEQKSITLMGFIDPRIAEQIMKGTLFMPPSIDTNAPSFWTKRIDEVRLLIKENADSESIYKRAGTILDGMFTMNERGTIDEWAYILSQAIIHSARCGHYDQTLAFYYLNPACSQWFHHNVEAVFRLKSFLSIPKDPQGEVLKREELTREAPPFFLALLQANLDSDDLPNLHENVKSYLISTVLGVRPTPSNQTDFVLCDRDVRAIQTVHALVAHDPPTWVSLLQFTAHALSELGAEAKAQLVRSCSNPENLDRLLNGEFYSVLIAQSITDRGREYSPKVAHLIEASHYRLENLSREPTTKADTDPDEALSGVSTSATTTAFKTMEVDDPYVAEARRARIAAMDAASSTPETEGVGLGCLLPLGALVAGLIWYFVF